jgi:hypothetical protein
MDRTLRNAQSHRHQDICKWIGPDIYWSDDIETDPNITPLGMLGNCRLTELVWAMIANRFAPGRVLATWEFSEVPGPPLSCVVELRGTAIEVAAEMERVAAALAGWGDLSFVAMPDPPHAGARSGSRLAARTFRSCSPPKSNTDPNSQSARSRIQRATRSPMTTQVRCVFARGIVGMIDASATRRPVRPRTRPC